jgi:uncharacterized protein (UPF0305 family)
MEDMMKALIQTINQSEKSNSQTIQELKNGNEELKNATVANSRDIQELKSYTTQAVAKIEWQIG